MSAKKDERCKSPDSYTPASNEETFLTAVTMSAKKDERSKSPDSYTPATNEDVQGRIESLGELSEGGSVCFEPFAQKRLDKATKDREVYLDELLKQKNEELLQAKKDCDDALYQLQSYQLEVGAKIQELTSGCDELRGSCEGLRLSCKEKDNELLKLQRNLLEKSQMLEVFNGFPWSAEEKRQAARADVSAKFQKMDAGTEKKEQKKLRPWVIVTPHCSTDHKIMFVEAANVADGWLTTEELKLLEEIFATDSPYFIEKDDGYILCTPSLLCLVNKNCVCSVYFKLEQSEEQSLAECGRYKDMLNTIVKIRATGEPFRTKAMEIIIDFSVSCLWAEVTILRALTAQVDGGLEKLDLYGDYIVSLLQDVGMFKDILPQAFEREGSDKNLGIQLFQSCMSVHAKLSDLSIQVMQARKHIMLQHLVGDKLVIMNESFDLQMKLTYLLGGGGYLASVAGVAAMLFHEQIIACIAVVSGGFFVGCCVVPSLPWISRFVSKVKSCFRGGEVVEEGRMS